MASDVQMTYYCPVIIETKIDEEIIESHFEIHRNGLNIDNRGECNSSESEIEFSYSNISSSTGTSPDSGRLSKQKLRRSFSAGNLDNLRRSEINSVGESLEDFNLSSAASCSTNSHASSTNLKKEELSNKVFKTNYRKSISVENLRNDKITGNYEKIKPKNILRKFVATKPQSPALMTKRRVRPTTVLSTEEREELEFKEAQKCILKSKPINRKILQAPVQQLQPSTKKPLTVQQPFKLSKLPTKANPPPKEETYQFQAKPVPKFIKQAPKFKEVVKRIIQAQSPKFSKRLAKENEKPKVENKIEEKLTKKYIPSKTIPKPFTFEKRDLQIQKKKEQLITEVIREEQKAREFHARPVPKSILTSAPMKFANSNPSFLTSTKCDRTDEINSEEVPTFKARPPKVLYTKPFEPKKPKRTLLEISEFNLNTVRRAKEREEFERKLKEKEDLIALHKQQEENEKRKQEELELAKLRKQTQHKAQPIRKYKELVIKPSNKLTEPITPKFHTDRLRNKENMSS